MAARIAPSRRTETRELHAFILELGRALSQAGAAVSEVQDRLAAIAAANGASEARIVALPTTLIVALGTADWATVEPMPQRAGTLRLDQISALYELVDEAERGVVAPADGLRRLQQIRSMPARHGVPVTILACAAMTVGLCFVLQPTLSDVTISGALGALVGVLVVATQDRPAATVLAPVLAATLVSMISFTAVKHGVADPGLRTLIAPLVTFLPGGALTTATVELAEGEMIAGASRLVFGGVQLLLLAFGIVAGAELVGLPREQLVDEQANLLGWWAPWLGVVVFGIASAVYFSAALRALPWMLIVLLVAWIGQRLGDLAFGPDVSGFFGALAMTPLTLAFARLPGGPPSQVTFLPAFWLLVPGALGLIGVTEVIGNPAAATVADLVRPVGAIVAIALGVLSGVALYRAAGGRGREVQRVQT